MKNDELQLFDVSRRKFSKNFHKAAQSKQMLRLSKIDMNCGMNYTSFPLFTLVHPYSRYRHSINVACILHDFTEQPCIELAGLFHDIATPAFSHTVDFMNGDHLNQESTESGTKEMILRIDGIEEILSHIHGTIDDVCNYHLYALADNNSPRLSADRLEYSLSNMVNYGFAQKEDALKCYADITVDLNEDHQPEFVFQHKEMAVWFAERALDCSLVYAGDEDRYCMEYLALLLKTAVEKNILNREDLWTDEENVISILNRSSLQKEWKTFENLASIKISHEYKNGWLRVDAKKRFIDPLWNGKRISSFDESFARRLERFLNTKYDYWIKGEEKSSVE